MATPLLAPSPPSAGYEDELIGFSSSLQKVRNAVRMVAPTDSAVLIQGETGTGKELVARSVHENSIRRHHAYVKLNCAAVPAGLLESELFGHERGAFTGAWTQTTGRFERAHNGTIFLDEIGDLPLELQPKLLRVLQEQEFERLGSSRTIRVNVRVVAATNQDLWSMVQERKFRADLFYRLNVFPIGIPPLRERKEDIPFLARHFVRKFAESMNKEINHISDEILSVLQLHDWPGNIRELQNVLERAVVLTSGPRLLLPHRELPAMVRGRAPGTVQTLAEAHRNHIDEVLRQCGGVIGGRDGAAARLGVARSTLLYRMQKLGLTPLRSPKL
ncbi:MAG TPA: sigma 54-interacting transcriptional regulator [Bryobacteraceae bacterium]|jgi:formate hydrogenlyase transcriptional activator|nr:sigma 54-interacting transcriptional regulator [Bryobacteraceae bacterium]